MNAVSACYRLWKYWVHIWFIVDIYLVVTEHVFSMNLVYTQYVPDTYQEPNLVLEEFSWVGWGIFLGAPSN